MSTVSTTTPQEQFDGEYITASEILKRTGVSRSALLHARERGMLPNVIVVQGKRMFLWNRKNVEPYLKAWELSLASRRGELKGSSVG